MIHQQRKGIQLRQHQHDIVTRQHPLHIRKPLALQEGERVFEATSDAMSSKTPPWSGSNAGVPSISIQPHRYAYAQASSIKESDGFQLALSVGE